MIVSTIAIYLIMGVSFVLGVSVEAAHKGATLGSDKKMDPMGVLGSLIGLVVCWPLVAWLVMRGKAV